MRPRALIATVLAVPILAVSATSSAHSNLVTTDPPDGSVVTTVSGIRLVFDEEVSAPRVVVRTASGLIVPVRLDRGGDAAVVVARPRRTLGAGSYTTVWRVRSADGHWVSGAFAFRIAR